MLSRIASRGLSVASRAMAAKRPALKDRYILFNIFEKPPVDDEGFVKQWNYVQDVVLELDELVSAHLHKCDDPDAKFPWVNYALFSKEETPPLGHFTPEFAKRIAVEETEMVIRPGEYVEVDSYNGEPLTYADKDRQDACRFFLTMVAVDDSVDVEALEDDWKKDMKVDFLHEKLKEHGVKDSLLYRQVKAITPTKPDMRFVVRTEVDNITDADGAAISKQVDQHETKAGVTTWTICYKVIINSRAEKKKC